MVIVGAVDYCAASRWRIDADQCIGVPYRVTATRACRIIDGAGGVGYLGAIEGAPEASSVPIESAVAVTYVWIRVSVC